MRESRFIQMVTTTDDRDNAQSIARVLVELKLAACVQILGPITSTYRWEGAVETAEEWQCLIKTRRDRLGDVEDVIRSLHPYDIPEIIAMPIVGGDLDYLSWWDQNVE
jgi:periplasmic divalent cation tolerance protein